MQSIIKILYLQIAFFEPENSNKNYIIQNESIYVHVKCHSNQSLFTQLSFPHELHHTNQWNQERGRRKMTWQIKAFFYTHQGVLMSNETGPQLSFQKW
jgi:hypothetical protein